MRKIRMARTGDAGGESSFARSPNRSYGRARKSPADGRTRSRHKLIIAIDGPAGSGKSSTAKAFAKHLGIPYIDTGAMYRAVTLKVMRGGISFNDTKKLVAAAKMAKIKFSGGDPESQRVFLDGRDVTSAIRDPELTKNVFYIAREPLVRRELVKKQRILGLQSGGVMEGRDIGTVVFPAADYKFYFEASRKIRAKRRWRELAATGKKVTLAQVLLDQKKRDKSDVVRKEGPLRRAKDAILIDTTSLTIKETIDKMIKIIQSNPLKRQG
jgi:cytidylate kinase